MLLDPADLVSRVLLSTGEWEPKTWAMIQNHLAPGSTLVDVGAHIGYCSLKAARIVWPHGHVIAVEANPHTAKQLRVNIEASAAEVTVRAVACAASSGMVNLFAAPTMNTGASSLCEQNACRSGPIPQVHRVPAQSLDAIIESATVSRVDVIKIDVEGVEFDVLRGAASTLSRFHPKLMIELDDRLLAPTGTSAAEVAAYLRSYGYGCAAVLEEANHWFVYQHT